ncbi:DUF2512 family protein [Alteribacillus sp. HJP-4]|uniref:DUF2512 family protein n=1 Tax=Alteribacillus sp. HJP-4 TaxID=2775394 RepID=UPI0035CD3704
MIHIKTLGMKTALISFVLLLVLTGFGNQWVNTMLLALLMVLISYVAAGDIFILKLTNNIVAIAADLVLTLLMVLVVSIPILDTAVPFPIALVAAILITAGEWFFHKYMKRNVHPELDQAMPS